MRKLFKNIFVCAAAAVLAVGGVALSACGTDVKPLEGDDYKSTELAVSNGGFAVEYGKYVYFINGATTYEDDNTFGTPVKGALMRIKKSDLQSGKNDVQTVIPSLIVSGDTTAGFFIYNDRVYYATPNNVKNMAGDIDKDWIEFKSASLNGSDIQTYIRLSDNSTVFRFVQAEKNGTVYLMYNGKLPDDKDSKTALRSYNTATGVCTTIAENSDSYVFNSVDKTDPYVYYTMSVKDNIDTDAPISMSYNQVYRARADVTEAPQGYDYTWNQDYLDDNKGVAPYVNLGTIVLDGVGKPSAGGDVTRFTHDYKDAQGNVVAEPIPPIGYTYTLQSYTDNGKEKGLYFTRKDITSAGDTVGGGASLYYLSAGEVDKTDAGGSRTWNSISGNKDKLTDASQGKLDVVAKPTETGNASASALFYLDEAGHHYIYVSGSNLVRADVNGATGTVEEQSIWYDAEGATLVCLDNRATAGAPYDYVWFTRTNGSGMSVERAVYNGSKEDYETLGFIGAGGTARDNAPYKAMKVLDVQHKTSWYNYELIADMVLFADAEAYGEDSFDYIGAVSLTKDGKYLNNAEFEKEVNDYWNFFMASDKTVGYFAKLSSDGKTSLSEALSYYFKTGKTDVFYDNIKKAVDLGKKENFLYTEDEKESFKDFSEGKGDAKDSFDQFLAKEESRTGEFKNKNTKNCYVLSLGTVSEKDAEAMTNYWSGYLKNFTVEEEEKTGLKDWEIALAVVIPVLGVAGAGVAVWLVLRNKKKKAHAVKPERMKVDTTDDRSVDVYHSGPEDAEEGNDGTHDES